MGAIAAIEVARVRGVRAAFFAIFVELFFATFLVDFFAAFPIVFFATFFADFFTVFFADFFTVFFADFFAVFFAVFFADFVVRVGFAITAHFLAARAAEVCIVPARFHGAGHVVGQTALDDVCPTHSINESIIRSRRDILEFRLPL